MGDPFIISRPPNAPRQLVWDDYTQAEHLTNWFGAKGLQHALR
jgi:uncharacterized protein YndB with AHSA1/START domain